MKRVYLGNKELTTIATRDSAGGGGGDDTQKWVDYFNGTLTEFTVPEGVTSVNPNTFVSCTGLTSLTLPSSVTSIGSDEHGMGGETNPFKTLKTMTVNAITPPTILGYGKIIPDTITVIYVPASSVNSYKSADKWSDYADNIKAIAQSETVVTYNDGTSKEFAITGELTDSSIENKDNATNVYIGTSVTSIGYRAFKQCFQLTAITLSDSVTYIDYEAFSYSYRFASITIPNSVTGFSTYAFAGCSGLESVTIENSANKLTYTNSLFYGISSTARLFVPSNLVSDYQSDSEWTNAFKGGIYSIGTSMKVTYTDGTEKTFYNLTTIDQNTDANKANAKSVEIFNGVKEIGSTAFYQCSSLTGITIPNSVKKIDMSAFNNCSSINSITIPNSVKELGGYVFQDCTHLASIDIGSSVSRLGESEFRRCSILSTVIIRNSTTKVTFSTGTYSKTFEGTPSSKKLYVPSNLLADYQADSAWTGAFGGGIFAIQ